MTSRATPRLRWDGGNQAHRVSLPAAAMGAVRDYAIATGRAMDDVIREAQRIMEPTAEETAARMRAFNDLFASTRPETRWEKVQFAFWDRWIAIRYGVPWQGHWPDLALGVAAIVLFVLFAVAAAWPDR